MGFAFDDHLKLLDYFQNRVLPHCDSSRSYEFEIGFGIVIGQEPEPAESSAAATEIIASLLQIPAINRCSDLTIRINYVTLMQLPIQPISDWLHRKSDGGQIQNGRILHIHNNNYLSYPENDDDIHLENAQEMVKLLTKVLFHFYNFIL